MDQWVRAYELKDTAQNLGNIIVFFSLHHLIFIVARIGVYLIIQILCCGCCFKDGDAEPILNHANLPEDKFDEFADYVASLNYEQFIVHDRRLHESRMGEIRERDTELRVFRGAEVMQSVIL